MSFQDRSDLAAVASSIRIAIDRYCVSICGDNFAAVSVMIKGLVALFISIVAASAFAENKQLEARVIQASASLLGKPYVVSPLGEGAGLDKDPLLRLDAFDCTTFVETSLALALSANSSETTQWLNRIRYKNGQVSFMNRNHFTNVDWVPNNHWLLRESTEADFPQNSVEMKTIISKRNWFQKNYSLVVNVSDQLSTLHYIPFVDIQQNPTLLNQLPDLVVVSIVRKNWNIKAKIGTDLDISHQALLLRTPTGFKVRHASLKYKKTIEQPALQFISEATANSKTAVGFQILELE